jgi:hypothetical protein
LSAFAQQISVRSPLKKRNKMSSTQGTLLDVLKKKMRQTKEEAERFQEEAEEYRKKLQIEIRRREEVSSG